MSGSHIFRTGQVKCYNSSGREIPCDGTGQDGDTGCGKSWPKPRFVVKGEVVCDELTGLVWTRRANLNQFPVTWGEALELIREMNQEKSLGFSDWRLPNRRELHSLMSYQEKKPALASGHPFQACFLGWYWTSTTAAINPAYAWYIHLEGARMFYGKKDQYYLFWPVRGAGGSYLRQSGQESCFDRAGKSINCHGTGQDGETRFGAALPHLRFVVDHGVALDAATGIHWLVDPGFFSQPVTWEESLVLIRGLNEQQYLGGNSWRLPNINELESLVDCSRHSPALPAQHPFTQLQDAYWSSTTSFFETDWAWTLYLEKGALGVGYKPNTRFFIWPVY